MGREACGMCAAVQTAQGIWKGTEAYTYMRDNGIYDKLMERYGERGEGGLVNCLKKKYKFQLQQTHFRFPLLFPSYNNSFFSNPPLAYIIKDVYSWCR